MNRERLFASLRGGLLSGGIKQSQVETIDAILDEAEHRRTPAGHVAYILATAYHELGSDMVATTEENLYYTKASRIRQVWPSRFPTDAAAAPYVKNPKALANKVYNGRMGNREGSDDGWVFRARGPSGTTGRDNPLRAGRALGVDLIANPERAADPAVGIPIMFEGMTGGWFTGVSLDDVDDTESFVDDRKVINGTDRAALIATYAEAFQKALREGGYSSAASIEAPEFTHEEVAALRLLAGWAAARPPATDAVLAWLASMPKEIRT